MTSIIDDIGMVIQAIRDIAQDPVPAGTWLAQYNPDLVIAPYYFNGRKREVVNAVASKAKYNKDRFPMIALNGDFQYTRRGTLIDYKLNLLIATSTKESYTTDDREDTNYIPILYPLYESFLYCFANIGLFQWDSTEDARVPPHQPINRYFYGAADKDANIKNMFDEPVDAIELVDLTFSRDVRDIKMQQYQKPPYSEIYL